jgi:hypothetical protein
LITVACRPGRARRAPCVNSVSIPGGYS